MTERERIAASVGVALLVAGLVLVGAVLPAEYGVDPLGTGRRLGLSALNDTQKAVAAFASASSTAPTGIVAVTPRNSAYRQETVDFKIAPGTFVEYKYRLEKGEALLYSWRATGRVNVDLHAEPDGAPRGYAESFEKQDRVLQSAGTLMAPFSGIHGWYWQTQTDSEVTVTLASAGFYRISHEFREGQPAKNKIFQ